MGNIMELEVTFPGGQRVDASYNGFQIKTDQSKNSGGEGSAPEPFSYFLASIATCTGIYILRFCQERNIPTDDISLVMNTSWNEKIKLIDTIDMTLKTGGSFPDKYKKAVIKAAKLCTVKRQLEKPPKIDIIIN